jgi:23S rRNA (pseudouridine1915-N3)-methyltransferase
MNISIITVGKLKEKFFKEAVEEYSARLSKYCKLNIAEVPDEKAPEKLSAAQDLSVLHKEGQGILKHIKEDTYAIVLAIQGRQLSSEAFAGFINDLGIKGRSNIAFIIGGSLGLSEEVLQRADFKLSFSSMTFPHQLMRVILLEQIYRGFKIIKGEPYHK